MRPFTAAAEESLPGWGGRWPEKHGPAHTTEKKPAEMRTRVPWMQDGSPAMQASSLLISLRGTQPNPYSVHYTCQQSLQRTTEYIATMYIHCTYLVHTIVCIHAESRSHIPRRPFPNNAHLHLLPARTTMYLPCTAGDKIYLPTNMHTRTQGIE